MIPITSTIAIDESELEFSAVRASGPGGQHVNKVSSAVQLRFDVRRSQSLPPHVRERLEDLAGNRLTNDGVLVIEAQNHRSQARNRDEAIARLAALIQRAEKPPRPRRATRPTKAARQRRIDEKKHRGRLKKLRKDVDRE